MPARRHRADEHAGVGRVVLHAHAVAEDRAAAERAGRVDGEHADRRVLGADRATRRSVSVDFPAPGAPVIPIDQASPACVMQRGDHGARVGRHRFDERDQLGDRALGHRARGASTSSAAATAGMRRRKLLVSDDFGDAGDAVHDDPLHAGLQRHHRHRAGATGADQRDVDDAVLVEAAGRRCRRRRSAAPGGSPRSPRGCLLPFRPCRAPSDSCLVYMVRILPLSGAPSAEEFAAAPPDSFSTVGSAPQWGAFGGGVRRSSSGSERLKYRRSSRSARSSKRRRRDREPSVEAFDVGARRPAAWPAGRRSPRSTCSHS